MITRFKNRKKNIRSGKTIFLEIISTELKPTSGQIQILGMNIITEKKDTTSRKLLFHSFGRKHKKSIVLK